MQEVTNIKKNKEKKMRSHWVNLGQISMLNTQADECDIKMS